MTAIPGREKTSSPRVCIGKVRHYLPLSTGRSGQSLGRAGSGLSAHPSWLLPLFPGSTLQAPKQVGFKVESAALVSTRTNLTRFPFIFILVSPGLCKRIISSSLPENSSVSCQHWQGPIWEPPSRVDMGVSVRPLTWQTFVCGHIVPRQMIE